jgi:hypothetical protein
VTKGRKVTTEGTKVGRLWRKEGGNEGKEGKFNGDGGEDGDNRDGEGNRSNLQW